MNWIRAWRHLSTGRIFVWRAFPASSLVAIEQAIQQSECRHEGEICFVVEPALSFLSLLRGQPPRERALEMFSKLRVWDTACNNGVLIYVLLADRDVEIIADRGISARVDYCEWETICREMESAFAAGDFESGVINGIGAIGNHLHAYFPRCKEEIKENEVLDISIS